MSPNAVTKWECTICGHECSTEDKAYDCERKGWPKFDYKPGTYIPEVDATIIKTIAVSKGRHHIATYQLDQKPNIPILYINKIVSQKQLRYAIKYRRTCLICDTVFPSLEEATVCQQQGRPAFIYRRQLARKLISSKQLVVRENGKHTPIYVIVEDGKHARFTEAQIGKMLDQDEP